MTGEPAQLPELMTEPQAAEKLGVSISTLRRTRRSGKIAHIWLSGRKLRYTMQHLADYLQQETVCATSSETTGSQSEPDQISGIERGSTPPLDKHAAKRLAQTILKKQS